MAAPKTTRIADDTAQSAPQTTAPGDAPADTWDPLERVSSAKTDKAAAAAAGHLTVNAVEPVTSAAFPSPADATGVRYSVNTHGTTKVAHNVDTGATTIVVPHAISTAYTKGQFIIQTGLYECTTAGTTASTKPTFNAAVGATVTDGAVTWTRRR